MTELSGRSIVVCRSLDQAGSLVEGLVDHGAEVVHLPLIEVVPPADLTPLSQAIANLDSYDWVIFTSVNAVEALITDGRPQPPGLRVAAVGPATNRAITDRQWRVDFVPEEATAEDLVASFPAVGGRAVGGLSVGGPAVGGTVLAPLAELAADTLEVGLEAVGYVVDRVTAYRTVTPTHSAATVAAAAAADAVIFTSPSTVDRWIEVIGDGALQVGPEAVCIGPSTARRAEARGLDVAAVANPHTVEGLIRAAVSHLGD